MAEWIDLRFSLLEMDSYRFVGDKQGDQFLQL